MYNRYIRNDNGSYARIPEEESRPGGPMSGSRPPEGPPPGGPAMGTASPDGPPSGFHPPENPPPGPPPPGGASPGFHPLEGSAPGGNPSGGPLPNRPGRPPGGPARGGRAADGLTGILQHFLDQFHLDHVDTGDLLLLALLFFLFREDADEELLVALGLLLIL